MNIKVNFQSAYKHYQEGNLQQAASICEEILKRDQENIPILHLIGVIYVHLGKYDNAITNLARAIQLAPNDLEGFYNLGRAFEKKGEFEKAIESYQTVIRLNPNFIDAYLNLGNAFRAAGNLDKAIPCYRKGTEIDPNNIGIHFNLAVSFQEKGQLDKAIFYYQKSLWLNPQFADAYHNLGFTLKEKNQLDDATSYFLKAIELNPNLFDAYNNLGTILQIKGQYNEAIPYFQKTIQLNPKYDSAYHNLGANFQYQGKFDEAIQNFNKAIELTPGYADAHLGLALTLLMSCDFMNGWREYEWRWETKDFGWRPFPMPLWDGSLLKGKTLSIFAEQGVGDEIMFASCLPEIIAEADLCILECDKRLMQFFLRSFPKIRVIERCNTLDQYPSDILQGEMRIAIGSLPKFLRPTLSSFPQLTAYLIPDIQKVENWRRRLSELGPGLKIGISWRGGSKPSVTLARSTVLEQWRKLFSLPEVHFINLQYGDCTEDLKRAKEPLGITIHDWEDADPLKDLDNFAAQISALDLVISVDNATLHMAGALGVPVWALLPFACDWRWMRKFEDTPWYKTVRLIRQNSLGDWGGVFDRVASNLKHYLSTGTMPAITHSYKTSLKNKKSVHHIAPLRRPLSSDRTYRCAVITPVGPGHEHLYQECLSSVDKAFAFKKGNFSEIISLKIADPEGNLGRSKARNLGIQQAAEQNVEWIFFLDADDIMVPSAFEYVSPYLEEYYGIWGAIWSIKKGETIARERQHQLPFLYSIKDVISCDPAVTLQMGHFVKTSVALSTPFNESLDIGEDFDYYLRVWDTYKCIKIPLPFFYNRRGLHSLGPRSASGNEWRHRVENLIKTEISKQKRINYF